jgi:Peptidase family C50
MYEAVTSEAWCQRLYETVRVVGPSSRGRFLSGFFCQLRLGEIRSAFENHSGMDLDTITSSCTDLAKPHAPKECRAWAFYYLGLIALQDARRTDALSELWAGFSNNLLPKESSRYRRASPGSLRMAREHLFAALSLLGPASNLLTRMVLRALALVSGPERDGIVSENSACILINTSIGCATRQSLCHLAKNANFSSATLLGALDVGLSQPAERRTRVLAFLDTLRQKAPTGWRFVSSTLCPTGEILITSMLVSEKDHGLYAQTVCIFPAHVGSADSHFLIGNEVYEAMINPLDTIIHRSQQQLRGTAALDPQAKEDEVSTNRQWWKERQRLDDELQKLLVHVEGEYFDSPSAREVLFGNHESPVLDDSSNGSSSNNLSICGDLTSRFEAVSLNLFPDAKDSHEPIISTREHSSTRPKLPIAAPRSPIDYQVETARRCADYATGTKQNSTFKPRGSCANEHPFRDSVDYTFLMLDETLHRFPFEGLPSFASRPVCRFPSLPFALVSLLDHLRPNQSMPVIDPERASYVIDPEANLSNTKERFLPFIQKMNDRYGWNWHGVDGQLPSTLFMEESLSRSNGILLYCGHGGGQVCFSRSKVEGLMNSKWSSDSEGRQSCQSSVILMGCSSGRLESVNRKGIEDFTNHAIFYEPEGIALAYLLAGAPCVVGNLWDVTDHDIDR